jgi:hypothetical protein
MKKLKVTFKRVGLRSDGTTPYYQVCFGQYLETAQDGTKIWHQGTSIFVSKEEYELINLGDIIMLDAAAA